MRPRRPTVCRAAFAAPFLGVERPTRATGGAFTFRGPLGVRAATPKMSHAECWPHPAFPELLRQVADFQAPPRAARERRAAVSGASADRTGRTTHPADSVVS